MGNFTTVQDFLNTIISVADQNASQQIYYSFPKEQTDGQFVTDPLVANRDYFRLTLCEMFLTKSKAWFVNLYPAVHSSVNIQFANRGKTTLSNVARIPEDGLSKGVNLNYTMTDLLPFNGGTVEISLALLALQGSNSLGSAIGILQDFSGLISAPILPALKVADKVTSGIQQLMLNGNGSVHLSMHQLFTADGTNRLRPGYFMVMLATQSQIDPTCLFVKEDRLYWRDGTVSNPMTGFDYMLFKIEGVTQRADWRLDYIEDPLQKAQEALLLGRTDEGETFKKSALLAALQAPDLTYADRRTVIAAIKEELDQVSGMGAVSMSPRQLDTIMSEHPTPATLDLTPPTFDEVFG